MFERVKQTLAGAQSLDQFRFQVEDIKCFVSRDPYTRSTFSCGCTGHSTALYGYPEGAYPSIEELAWRIASCLDWEKGDRT